MEITYRMVMALILVPNHLVEDLETDMYDLCVEGGMETVRVTYADNHWYNLQGQVVKKGTDEGTVVMAKICLLYTSPSPRDGLLSRMPSSA